MSNLDKLPANIQQLYAEGIKLKARILDFLGGVAA
jgi:hypothetical protein